MLARYNKSSVHLGNRMQKVVGGVHHTRSLWPCLREQKTSVL